MGDTNPVHLTANIATARKQRRSTHRQALAGESDLLLGAGVPDGARVVVQRAVRGGQRAAVPVLARGRLVR
jgi:hypothetical protein